MPTRTLATNIVTTLQKQGHIAYFAGGWVRDHLLQTPSDDIDIATSASVEEIQKLFPKTIPVGIAFGIVIVVEGGHQFEVATFRKESEYVDGRRPDKIEPASPEEDAQRRDFTINGLFFDPLTNTLLDFVDGVADLHKGVIRAIGDPHHRFLEDKLRMIRAVRYSSRFHFPIEENTEKAIRLHAKDLFPAVAIERIWQEFQKMSHFADFYKGLEKLHELSLLSQIFPSLASVSLEELHQRLQPLPPFPPLMPLIVELVHLFPQDSLEKHLQLCDYLKLSKKDKDHVLFFHKAKSLLDMPLDWQKNVENIEWAHFYAHPLSSLYLSLFSTSFAFHQENQKKLAPYVQRIENKTPLIKAIDLQAEGISPGPLMGTLLQEAERIAANGLLLSKDTILSLLKKNPLWPTP